MVTRKISILIEESINVDGHFEYIIRRDNRKICIIEANKDDIKQGMALAARPADTDSVNRVYNSIVTSYHQWAFFLKSG